MKNYKISKKNQKNNKMCTLIKMNIFLNQIGINLKSLSFKEIQKLVNLNNKFKY